MPSQSIDAQWPPALHDLEQEVMEAVWRLRETAGRPVLDAVNARSGRDRHTRRS